MKILGDYHTHTNASDGHSTFKDNVNRACELGLQQIAITDHSFGTLLMHHTLSKFKIEKKLQDDINKQSSLKVLVGVEGNLLNANGDMDVPTDVIKQSDILLVGFHRFLQFKHLKGNCKFVLTNGFAKKSAREKLIETNTNAYLLALDRYPIDIIAHLNHRTLVDVKRVCEKAKEKDVYIELNEKHINVLEDCVDDIVASGVKLIVGSDAHNVDRVGNFAKIEQFLEKHNIPQNSVYGIGKLPTFKDKSEWNNGNK